MIASALMFLMIATSVVNAMDLMRIPKMRQPDAVIPQCAVIDRNVSFCHGRLLSLSRIDNRISSIMLRQSSGFNSDL